MAALVSSVTYSVHSHLSDRGKTRLGSFLARYVNGSDSNNGPVQVSLILTQAQTQSVGLIFRGPFQQDHALCRFYISSGDEDTYNRNISLSLKDWKILSQYLGRAPLLRDLELADLSLGRGELELLASAVQGAELMSLQLTRLNVDENSLGNLLASIDHKKLVTLGLATCGVGLTICDRLTNILCNGETKLAKLNLFDNHIDDECVRVLCGSLPKNKYLKAIALHFNRDITDVGWGFFEKLVLDKSSLGSIYRSNHSLEEIVGCPQEISNRLFPLDGGNICGLTRGQAKIFRSLANDASHFDIKPFLNLDVQMMPFFLEFFQKVPGIYIGPNHDRYLRTDCAPLFYLFQIIRRWKLPGLFSFPSAEKVRINSLETKNHELMREMELLKSEMELLKSEHSRLNAENALLSSKNESLEANEKLKRTRLN